VAKRRRIRDAEPEGDDVEVWRQGQRTEGHHRAHLSVEARGFGLLVPAQPRPQAPRCHADGDVTKASHQLVPPSADPHWSLALRREERGTLALEIPSRIKYPGDVPSSPIVLLTRIDGDGGRGRRCAHPLD
jgi:hypothetical protein